MDFERPDPIGNRVMAFIQASDLRPGDRLPSETEMAQRLGISRATVREAYARLTTEGVISRRHGVGTFLNRVPIDATPGRIHGFWNSIEDAGYKASRRILGADRVAADAEVAAKLGCDEGAEVPRLLWLFAASGEPVVYVEHFLAPGFDAARVDWESVQNLLTALATDFDLSTARLDTWRTAVNAPANVAKALKLEPGAAVLYGLAVVYARDGAVPVFSRTWMDPERMGVHATATIHLPRPVN